MKGGNSISSFYAVVKGRCLKPQIYESWTECEKIVKGYSGAIYKKFTSEDKAISYIKSYVPNYTKPKKIKGDNSKQKNVTKKELDLKHKIYQEVRKSDKGTVGENIVSTYLRYFNIKYKLQYEVIINNHKHLFDFGIFKNKRVIAFIEYDGIQHFEAIDKYGGEEGLKLRQERDKEKDKYCVAENIKLLRIPHSKSNKVESIIKEEIIPLINKTIRKKKIDTKKKKQEKDFYRISCEQLSEMLNYQVTLDLLSVWTVVKNLKASNKTLKIKVYSVIRRGKSFEVALKDKKYIINK